MRYTFALVKPEDAKNIISFLEYQSKRLEGITYLYDPEDDELNMYEKALGIRDRQTLYDELNSERVIKKLKGMENEVNFIIRQQLSLLPYASYILVVLVNDVYYGGCLLFVNHVGIFIEDIVKYNTITLIQLAMNLQLRPLNDIIFNEVFPQISQDRSVYIRPMEVQRSILLNKYNFSNANLTSGSLIPYPLTQTTPGWLVRSF